MFKMKSLSFLISFCCVVSGLFATQKDFTGAVNNSWNNPNNWSPVGIPTATDSVYSSYGDDIVIPSGFNAEAKYVRLLADFYNYGTLTIEGGKVDAFWNFYNHGSLTILNSTADVALDIDPIQTQPMVFENYGEIYIDGATGDAIAQYTYNKLYNFQNGFISLKNYDGKGFRVVYVENFGRIRMEDSGVAGFCLDVATDTLINGDCGKFNNFNNWEVLAGLVQNEGLIRHTSNAGNIFDTNLMNNGVVEDLNGNFSSSTITNTGIWIKPYSNPINEGEPTEVFNVISSPEYSCSGLYNDRDLTSYAGDYNNEYHLWTPNDNAVGDTLLYLEIVHNAIGCRDTVRFKPVTPVVSVNYWLGGSGSWMNASKWSYGTVPVISDKIGIYKSDAEVWIPNNASVSVKDLFLKGDFLVKQSASFTIEEDDQFASVYCDSCMIVNNGIIQMNKPAYGLFINRGKLINNQDIQCDSTALAISYSGNESDTSTYIKNYGTISGSYGSIISGWNMSVYNYGDISLSNIVEEGLDSEHFFNFGNIQISGNGPLEGRGITRNLHNEASGIVSLNSMQYGLYDSEFFNAGQISIDSCAIGISVSDDSENQSSGIIEVSNSDFGISQGDFLYNLENSLISITKCDVGLSVFSSLYNDGEIQIDSSFTAGIQLFGNIYNRGTGQIQVEKSLGDGLVSSDGSNILQNLDTATIEVRNCQGNGIRLLSADVLNEASAIISIDSIISDGLYLGTFGSSFSSDLSNEGEIRLGSNILGIGLSSDGDASFVNESCNGKVISESSYDFAGTFTNLGIYEQAAPATILIYPNFTNEGIISDKFHAFQGQFFSNSGIHLIEKSGEYEEGEVVNNVLSRIMH